MVLRRVRHYWSSIENFVLGAGSELTAYIVTSAHKKSEFRQNSDRIQNKASSSAQPKNRNYLRAKQPHSILTPYFRLLNSQS